ncbi:MAG: alpha-L-glutamate ligase-like protein [Pseudomonadota bacterium]
MAGLGVPNLFKIHKAMKANGVVGINGRNLDFVFAHNPRRFYPVVDDKVTTKHLAIDAGVPVPKMLAVLEYQGHFDRLKKVAADNSEFVIKPARGSGGGGILVIGGATAKGLRKASGAFLPWEDVRFHANNIFSGMFSLGGGSDRILVEERLRPHPVFDKLAFKGVPDLRLIVFRGVPIMAMLRLPTSLSDGRANLHLGGIGAGVDMATGLTTKGVCFNKPVERHPDFDTPIGGVEVPNWSAAVDTALKLGQTLDLGYIGVDLVVDETHGPTMLELNARPGISIQIANGCGLGHRLSRVAGLDSVPEDLEARRALAETIWAET